MLLQCGALLKVTATAASVRGPIPLGFSTARDAQELYCMLDSGYSPRHFAFGNIAYSVDVGGGILGALKSMGRGEVKEFSDVTLLRGPAFDKSRALR